MFDSWLNFRWIFFQKTDRDDRNYFGMINHNCCHISRAWWMLSSAVLMIVCRWFDIFNWNNIDSLIVATGPRFAVLFVTSKYTALTRCWSQIAKLEIQNKTRIPLEVLTYAIKYISFYTLLNSGCSVTLVIPWSRKNLLIGSFTCRYTLSFMNTRWAVEITLSGVRAHTCRSCMLITHGKARFSFVLSSATSIWAGVVCSKIWPACTTIKTLTISPSLWTRLFTIELTERIWSDCQYENRNNCQNRINH